ncbi:hypothetical protein ACWDFR_27890 [Streptomyces sp. 900105755]
MELPWGGPEDDRERKKFPLILTTTYGNALRANISNVEVWKPAPAAVGVIPVRNAGERWKASRKDGFHVLRHTYASVILEAGESVVTLARWLGHSTPTITLPSRPVSGTLFGRLREEGRSIAQILPSGLGRSF